MVEKRFLIEGAPISASLFDFGLYFFHNCRTLVDRKHRLHTFTCPRWRAIKKRVFGTMCLYLRKSISAYQMEQFVPRFSLKRSPTAFEMDEILYELSDHSAGLNCGRWDYIFSFIKKFRNHPDFALPGAGITMAPALPSLLVEMLIKTCHRRGVFTQWGAWRRRFLFATTLWPTREAMEQCSPGQVAGGARRTRRNLVAHPGLVPVAKAIFDEYMPEPEPVRPPRPSVIPGLPKQNLLGDSPKVRITAGRIRTTI